jgi:short-subunit dehydrogenase involved in D-alanine esterification of teichoic acids
MNLEGKFAVVTGGGSGIGLAITKALRAAGSDVLIVGRNETRLNAAGGDDSLILTVAADPWPTRMIGFCSSSNSGEAGHSTFWSITPAV